MDGVIMSGDPTKIKHVGLILYVTIDGVLYALLQKRGEYNHEKMCPESWPGGCQPTVHGKVEEGESPETALYREITEEIGEKMFNGIQIIPGFVRAISRTESFPEDGAYFVAMIHSKYIKDIQLGPSTGGLRLISFRQVVENGVIDIATLPKDQTVPHHITAMFSDYAHLLRFGFGYF